MNDVVKFKDVTDKFVAQDSEPYLTTPQEFAAVLKADIAKWSQVVKSFGVSLD